MNEIYNENNLNLEPVKKPKKVFTIISLVLTIISTICFIYLLVIAFDSINELLKPKEDDTINLVGLVIIVYLSIAIYTCPAPLLSIIFSGINIKYNKKLGVSFLLLNIVYIIIVVALFFIMLSVNESVNLG